MKVALALCLVAGCIPAPTKLEATSKNVLAADDAQLIVVQPRGDVARLLVEKMTERGFPLVDRRVGPAGLRLKFAGNRDFSGTYTIGSVFYAWIVKDKEGQRISLVGKPTLDHAESCPQIDDEPKCTIQQAMITRFGILGAEEAQTIRGVFAEIALDADPVVPATPVATP